MNYEDVLNVKLRVNSADARTVREYLYKLLSQVWNEKDSFSGKRPFDNSDWEGDLIAPLLRYGFLEMDEFGGPNMSQFNAIIQGCIYYIFDPLRVRGYK